MSNFSESLLQDLQALLDRDAIMRLLARYLRGIDRMDRELVRSTFHPDARDDHGKYISAGVEPFIDAMWEAHDLWSFHQHTVTNSLVEVNGNRGVGEHYLIGYLGLDAGASRDQIEQLFGAEYVRDRLADGKLSKPHYWRCGGRYLDKYEKRNGEWRFLLRTVRMEWGEKAPGDEWLQGMAARQGRDSVPRDRSDDSYALFEWLKAAA